jgi:hypothetical protein
MGVWEVGVEGHKERQAQLLEELTLRGQLQGLHQAQAAEEATYEVLFLLSEMPCKLA